MRVCVSVCMCGLGMRLGGMVRTWSELSHKYKCLLGLVKDEDR